jgi:hypothetical protein
MVIRWIIIKAGLFSEKAGLSTKKQDILKIGFSLHICVMQY